MKKKGPDCHFRSDRKRLFGEKIIQLKFDNFFFLQYFKYSEQKNDIFYSLYAKNISIQLERAIFVQD